MRIKKIWEGGGKKIDPLGRGAKLTLNKIQGEVDRLIDMLIEPIAENKGLKV